MTTPEHQRRLRREELYQLLSEGPEPEEDGHSLSDGAYLPTRSLTEGLEPNDIDRKISDPMQAENMAGVASLADGEPIEFVEHQCWRMLLTWPHEDDETIPGRVQCMGCGAVGRVEMEHQP